MRVTTSQYEIYLISGQNSHLPSQNVFLQSVIYSTKKTIILAWGKSRVFSTDPPFLHRRDNNDCRPLHGTWRTLCMNKHLINKAVGRTQKTSFPLAASPKLSSAPILKQIPVLARANPSNQHPSFYSESFRNLFITHGTEYREWLVENITWQLVDSLHRDLVNWNSARGWEKRVIRTNITYAKRRVRIFSVFPQSRSPFSASFQTFCFTARAFLNTQKYGLFCGLLIYSFIHPFTHSHSFIHSSIHSIFFSFLPSFLHWIIYSESISWLINQSFVHSFFRLSYGHITRRCFLI